MSRTGIIATGQTCGRYSPWYGLDTSIGLHHNSAAKSGTKARREKTFDSLRARTEVSQSHNLAVQTLHDSLEMLKQKH
jgi:hypothetical protein